jgi:hypothetical protein
MNRRQPSGARKRAARIPKLGLIDKEHEGPRSRKAERGAGAGGGSILTSPAPAPNPTARPLRLRVHVRSLGLRAFGSRLLTIPVFNLLEAQQEWLRYREREQLSPADIVSVTVGRPLEHAHLSVSWDGRFWSMPRFDLGFGSSDAEEVLP